MEDRNIKKLWHINRKEFIYEFSILQTVNSEGIIEHSYFERNKDTLELELLPSCQIIEINCTGLKDSEGNLIFENDIVQITSDYAEFDKDFASELAVITYRNEIARWCFEYEPKNNSGEHIKDLVCDFYHFLKNENLEYVKIIGNIHEHPHLLTKEK